MCKLLLRNLSSMNETNILFATLASSAVLCLCVTRDLQREKLDRKEFA